MGEASREVEERRLVAGEAMVLVWVTSAVTSGRLVELGVKESDGGAGCETISL